MSQSNIPDDANPTGSQHPELWFLESFCDYARNDVHAQAFWDAKNNRWGYKPIWKAMSSDLLLRHLNSTLHLGCYFAPPGTGVVKMAALDLDNHKNSSDWQTVCDAAALIMHLSREFGLNPLPFRSGGGQGIHLFYFWETPQSAKAVRAILRLIIAAAGFTDGSAGISKSEIEIFPKQDVVSGDELGNLIALPLSRESVPLTDSLEPSSKARIIVTSCPLHGLDAEATDDASSDLTPDVAELAEALRFIPADDYTQWVTCGLALKNTLPDTGFEIWDSWAKTSSKYDGEASSKKKWDRFPSRAAGVTVRSIYFWARQNGWKPKSDANIEPRFAEFCDILENDLVGTAFPLTALPEPFFDFISNISAVMQVQPDLVAGPILTVAASMLGRDWRIRPEGERSSWSEPSILWTVCVAGSGSMKSAAAKEAMKFVQQMQIEFRDVWRNEMASWNALKAADDQDPGPRPLLESCYVSDTTVESLKPVLSDDQNRNPRGIVFYSDELAGWFNGLDQYKGKGNDRQTYLSLYDGDIIRIDRKSDGDPVIISRTALSICGGVQPSIVPSLFRRGEDGLTPRFQVLWPEPYGKITHSTVKMDPVAQGDVRKRLRAMRNSKPASRPEMELTPSYYGDPLVFDEEAQAQFDDWCVSIRNRKEKGGFGSYVEKQRGLIARLSLILHGMERGELASSTKVDVRTLRNAKSLADYFESHQRKLLGEVDAHPGRPGSMKIADWIRRKKRMSFTSRDIRQNDWKEFSKENDETSILASLRFLEARGWLRLDEKLPGKRGGRSTIVATVNPIVFAQLGHRYEGAVAGA